MFDITEQGRVSYTNNPTGFDRLTGLTKYCLLTAPRPLSPIFPAEQAAPLGRRVSGDGVLRSDCI